MIISYAKRTSLSLEVLKTYVLKTEFLWFASGMEADTDKANEWNFLNKFVQLCKNLESGLQRKKIRNFFIPNQNLIEHLSNDDLYEIIKWFRERLIDEKGRCETLLAVLHGKGCEFMRLKHNTPFRNSITDCSVANTAAVLLSNLFIYGGYIENLLRQLSPMIMPSMYHTDNARL
jgi:hypothetical protein